MNKCADSDFKKEEKKQEALLRKLMAKISPKGKVKLKEAQKNWVTYRKSQCEFEVFGYITGSIHPMVYTNCLERLTYEQNKKIRHQLNCVEGDLSCGWQ